MKAGQKLDVQYRIDAIEAAAHWNMLANAADDRARYEESRGSSGNAYRNQAETFRRIVVSLYLEIETGVSHCVCCLKPSGVCR